MVIIEYIIGICGVLGAALLVYGIVDSIRNGNFGKDSITIAGIFIATAISLYVGTDIKNEIKQNNDISIKAGQYIAMGQMDESSTILWKVMKADQKLLTLWSEEILGADYFDKNSSAWLESSAQQWLVNKFYPSAFEEEERKLLLELDGDKCVTLPSLDELIDEDYDFMSTAKAYDPARVAKGSKWAIDAGLTVYDGNNGSYYTKTAVPNKNKKVYAVMNTGAIEEMKCDQSDIGLRPMIRIRNSGNLFIGEGTRQNPYIVTNEKAE